MALEPLAPGPDARMAGRAVPKQNEKLHGAVHLAEQHVAAIAAEPIAEEAVGAAQHAIASALREAKRGSMHDALAGARDDLDHMLDPNTGFPLAYVRQAQERLGEALAELHAAHGGCSLDR